MYITAVFIVFTGLYLKKQWQPIYSFMTRSFSVIASRRCNLSPERSVVCQLQGISHWYSSVPVDLMNTGSVRSTGACDLRVWQHDRIARMRLRLRTIDEAVRRHAVVQRSEDRCDSDMRRWWSEVGRSTKWRISQNQSRDWSLGGNLWWNVERFDNERTMTLIVRSGH